MARVASLPMYDFPEVAGALDDFWTGLRRHMAAAGLDDVPPALVHGRPLRALWDDPACWFTQCCGYDLVHRYAEVLRPLATPCFVAPECTGWQYTSLVLVAEDFPGARIADLAGRRCALNGRDSHSGMNALRALIAPLRPEGRFFAAVHESGSYATSIAMLVRGEADVCAVDCVTHALLDRYRPEALAGTRCLGITARAPGIPYVVPAATAADDVARMRAALDAAFADPDLAAIRAACCSMTSR